MSKTCSSALFVLLASTVTVNAGLISVNFTNSDLPRQILSLESTGVIATTGWENISESTSNILSTVVDITLDGATIDRANTARDFGNSDGTNGFLALYEAGLRDSTPTTLEDTFVTVSDMTAFLAAEGHVSYDIYAYYKSPVNADPPLDTIALGLTTGTFIDVNPDGASMSSADGFVGSSFSESNYMVFTGLTADSTTVFMNRVHRDGLLAGIQIQTVAVPEPSSLALLAIGAAGLIGYGWRRRGRLSAS